MSSSYSPRAARAPFRAITRPAPREGQPQFCPPRKWDKWWDDSDRPGSSGLSACFPFESDTRLTRADRIRVGTIGCRDRPVGGESPVKTRLELPEKPMSA